MAYAPNPDVSFYSNSLKKLLTDPSSFTTDPGYQFAKDQALDGVMRANSSMLGSGNIATALADRAGGMASQAYDGRVNQLAALLGTSDQYDLGSRAADTADTRAANDFTLGTGANATAAARAANDFTLGKESADTTRDLGFGNLDLGFTKAGQDYDLGLGANANAAQRTANDFTLGSRGADTAAYGAQTQRGAAQANAFTNNSKDDLDWTKFYYQLYPRQRVAGAP